MTKKKDRFDIELGLKLREARMNRNMSQTELCKRCGIPRSTYATWELGLAPIPMKKFIDVCNALGVNYVQLADSVM